MRDSSAIPVRRVEAVPQPKQKAEAALPAISPSGPRKLVRPRLPDGLRPTARIASIAHGKSRHPAGAKSESSHAEAFYFQKQIVSQTPMIFVLEDGEQIEGQIEWYDRNSIKVRHGGLRTLIYKSGIKYLYKAVESATK